jgi:hypothetical protein
MAPEVLTNPCTRLEEKSATRDLLDVRNIVPYTSKVDVWAAGVRAASLGTAYRCVGRALQAWRNPLCQVAALRSLAPSLLPAQRVLQESQSMPPCRAINTYCTMHRTSRRRARAAAGARVRARHGAAAV